MPGKGAPATALGGLTTLGIRDRGLGLGSLRGGSTRHLSITERRQIAPQVTSQGTENLGRAAPPILTKDPLMQRSNGDFDVPRDVERRRRPLHSMWERRRRRGAI